MSDNLARQQVVVKDGFMSEYITGIPWNENPAFAFSNDASGYLEAFANVIERIPIGEGKIRFEDDVWNFNPYFKDVNTTQYRIVFTRFPEELKNYAKFYAIFSISGKKKISTVERRINECCSLIIDTMKAQSFPNFFLITEQDVIQCINSCNISYSYKASKFYSAFDFIRFLKNNYRLSIAVDLGVLEQETAKYRALTRRVADENKTPNIPEVYFQKIRSCALNVMRDPSLPYAERATAAMMIIQMETGLRSSDLMALRTDALRERVLAKSGREVKILHFTSQKPSAAHAPLLEFDIFSTDVCTEAFLTMKEIREECEMAIGHDYLYVLPQVTCCDSGFPIRQDRYVKHYRRLVEQYLPEECSREWDDAIGCTKGSKGQTVYIPTTMQFRVHLCSYLYNEQHLPLTWIQRYMGHLSEAMLGYYVRLEDTYQENILNFGQVIREIHDDRLRLLGGSGAGEEIAARINEFIDKNNLSVANDAIEVAQAVKDRVVIRAKTGGVCIKTSLMPCSKDARTTESMCAYGLCPNFFQFFYMVDVSYADFKTTAQTVEVNQGRGHIRAAQKELGKLNLIINKRLLPQLNEMDNEIRAKGVDAVLSRYPHLLDIINEEDTIREEIEKWKKTKIRE